MSTTRDWIQASRPLAQANLAIPLLFGQALAYHLTGRFSWDALGLVMLFGVLDHLVIVFGNDYADRDDDVGGERRTIFSGGSGVLPERRIEPASLRQAALVSAVALLVLSGVLAFRFALAPLFALAAVGLLFAYSYPPLRASYRGHGEWLQGVGVGAVLPLLAYGVQAGSLERFPWPVLAGTILLGVAGNIATALPDLEDDRRAKKRTWVVRRGRTRSAWDCAGVTLIALAVLFISLPDPAPAAAAFAALPLLVAVRFAPRTRAKSTRFILLQSLSASGALLGSTVALFCA